MPFISIITVIKGDARLVKYTGRSLMLQHDAPSFEWIVIGDAPYDVMQEFESLKPVTIATSEDALNKGLKAATGDYVWFLEASSCLSDMYVLRDAKSDIVMQFMPDLFYGNAREDGNIRAAKPFDGFARGMITDFQAMAFRRRVIGDLAFDQVYTYAYDYDFVLRFIDKTQKIAATNRILTDTIKTGTFRDDVAVRAEYFRVRETLLKQSLAKNTWINRTDAIKQSLKRAFPKVYWAGRSLFVPYERERKSSPVKSGRRGIFFKRKA